LLVILLVGFIRFRLLDMPLERDEGEYAYAGQLMLQGIPPYELAYNLKLPGTYFAYALGMAVFGQNVAGVHLTLLVVNSLTILFVFLLGRKLLGVTAGLVACATYGVLAVSPAVMGMAAHANHFVVFCAAPAMLLLWKADESNGRSPLFFSGLLCGLAFVMKQQGICFGLFAGFFLLWRVAQAGPVFSAGFARKSFWFGLGMALPFLLVCLFLARAGVFPKFWFWTFGYASSYATHESLSDGAAKFADYFQKKFVIYAGFFLLTVLGLAVAGRIKAIHRETVFSVALFIFSFLGTAIGLYFREHYFILTLPAFAILVGLAVVSLQKTLMSGARTKHFRMIPLLLFAGVLGWNIFLQRQMFFQWPAVQVFQTIYPEEPFIEAPVVAGYIQEHSSPNARVAVLGSEPEIYFYSQRHSATGYLYVYALMEPQPYALKMQREMIGEIESHQPEYLVWVGSANSWAVRSTSGREIFDWFNKYSREHYEITGLAAVRLAGQVIFLWDADARNFHDPVEQSLVIYKRKSAPVIAPAKTD
jgi:4-amino-4-deoxy-L-arabinose transferase-like glycosyltransferase